MPITYIADWRPDINSYELVHAPCSSIVGWVPYTGDFEQDMALVHRLIHIHETAWLN